MQVFLRWYFVTGMLMDHSVAIIQVTVSVAAMQLDVFAAHTQVKVSAANMWVTIFVAIMQVVFSAVHYAHDCFYCNYTGDSLVIQATVSSYNFIFLSLTGSLFL